METEEKTAAALASLAALRITPAILSLVGEIDEFKGAWRAIGRIAPQRLSGLRRVATIESIGASTRLAGARLTNREVELLLSDLQPRLIATRGEQAVAGYAQVLETVLGRPETLTLTETRIRRLHRDLLAHRDEDEGRRDAPRPMAELAAWARARERDKALHPLLAVAVFVAVFLDIRPFGDGNGRLARLLTTLLLLRAGYAHAPYSSLDSIIEQSKESQDTALARTSATLGTPAPDWNPWLEFFLGALVTQKRRLEKKLEREAIILSGLPGLSVHILELTRHRGRLSIAEAVKATGANRNTIKDHVRRLADQGHLTPHGAGRGAWYSGG
jgi:Fic family protein